MARAAELLKWTWPAWPPALEAAFNRWVTRVILPNLRSEALARLPLGNWHTAVAEAKAQLAVLRGDRRLFDEALRGWAVVAEAYLKPSGECSETRCVQAKGRWRLAGLFLMDGSLALRANTLPCSHHTTHHTHSR